MEGPLKGIKIVSVEHWLAMPAATSILAQWGADVIKIENPQGGDPARGWQSAGIIPYPTILNPMFEYQNLNKKSVAIDLGNGASKEVMQKLIDWADVFTTNLHPKVLAKYRLDYETLNSWKPAIIYVSLTGYGNEGPDKDRPGYDICAFWARSGLMAFTGEPDGPPAMHPHGIGDSTTSMLIAGATSAALFARERTGKGQKVDLCLYHTGMWANGVNIATSLYSGHEVQRWDSKNVGNPLVNRYQTKNGKWLFICCLQSDRAWSRFCQALGQPELEHEERFSSHQKRMKNNKELIQIIEERMATKPGEEWEHIFEELNIVYGPIMTNLEVTKDPQVWDNRFLTEIEHPSVGNAPVLTSPGKFNSSVPEPHQSAPELGQHTEEVLIELGYTWEDIMTFKEKGLIL